MVDLWHLWDTPDIERHLADNVDRITGVHVANWFEGDATIGRCPGEGVSRTAELMRVLRDAGWQGPGTSRSLATPDQPDSLWSLDVDEAARRAYAAIAAV